MSIYRRRRERQICLSTNSLQAGLLGKRVIKKVTTAIATAVFCVVIGIGTVSYAYEETPGVILATSCNIRATTDTNGAVLGSAKKDQTVSICDEVTGSDGNIWYQVWVDGTTKGYIRSDLVKKSDTAGTTGTTTQTATTTTDLPETQATAVEEKTGTVNTNNVRIRKGASTAYGVVATANKGMSLTVTGEATANDGKKWYQVKFTYNAKDVTGFIRSDLVTFGTVTPDPLVSEITGEGVEGQPETAEEPATETEPVTQEEPQTQEEETTQSNDNSTAMTLMNVTETPYVMSGFAPIILKWEDQDINAYKNGDFYIFYAQQANGEQGWFVFDSTQGTYQRYVYTSEGATTGDDNSLLGGILPIIILVVVIVILLAVIGLLFIRLREYTIEEYDDDDDDDELEDDETDLMDDEEFVAQEPMEKPRRRPERKPERQVEQSEYQERGPVEEIPRPVRRTNYVPEGNARRTEGNRQVRRPEEAEVRREDRPVRTQGDRPVRNSSNRPARTQGNRPVRTQNGDLPRRPENGPRRPSAEPQRRPVRQPQQQSQGYKAQNFLENENQDDIEFIDL